ncbi:hypothetical protein I5Q65_08115 [Pseudomonas aeruginosa]|uniref:Uncharacterized protein n=1 Tax=Pseudomonas phage JD18 TaxID=1225791 RepID=J9STK0_9CAUD|nr:hypothetical protein HMPREFV_HMPID9843gp0036 [Pseudomonas phage JD18]KSP48752.1 hypothetical protein APB19_25065 [Pseudomonas aeruginosa]AFR52189.1 hypothetical protein HMPREFV_HMPID9843gp0036 [Pseudomonas phage JD18]MBH3769047.1 hypothetical protein [Pseudomonas aeruginosa]MCS7791668.1 hypothetical protein [Pseudomonas aeruginosa]QKE66995.1 hypothetical protein HP562_06545 [Pseudomonas aeruginosa]
MARKPSNDKVKAAAPAAPANTGAQPPVEENLIDGQLAGVQLQDGAVVPLAELPEAELRQIGTDMEIQDAATLAIEQLVAAIQAQKVLLPAGDEVVSPEAAESPLRIADEVGRYQVLLSDGSLAYLEDLVQEDLEALAAACYELAIQSRGGELGRTIGVDLAAGLKDRFIVQRERLDHDGETYTLGDPIYLDSPQAAQLLPLGAIEREQP